MLGRSNIDFEHWGHLQGQTSGLHKAFPFLLGSLELKYIFTKLKSASQKVLPISTHLHILQKFPELIKSFLHGAVFLALTLCL